MLTLERARPDVDPDVPALPDVLLPDTLLDAPLLDGLEAPDMSLLVVVPLAPDVLLPLDMPLFPAVPLLPLMELPLDELPDVAPLDKPLPLAAPLLVVAPDASLALGVALVPVLLDDGLLRSTSPVDVFVTLLP